MLSERGESNEHNLKISVSKEPKDGGIVSYRNITIRERLLRFLLGEKHKLLF